MKLFIKVNLVLTALLLLLAASALAQTPTPKPATPTAPPATAGTTGGDVPLAKIAIVNTAAFAENIGELKVLYDKLYAEFAPRQQEITTMRSSMDLKQKQLDDNGAKMTAPQIRKLQEEIEQLKKDGTRRMEDYQAELTKREDTLTGPTYGKINEFLMKYTTEKGITIAWNAQAIVEKGILLYIDTKADITANFIMAYNKAHPVAATPAPAPTAAKKP